MNYNKQKKFKIITNTTNLNIRTEKEIKKQAELICTKLGLNMMFLRAIIRQNGIPFVLQLNSPNNVTIEAIQEARTITKDDNIQG